MIRSETWNRRNTKSYFRITILITTNDSTVKFSDICKLTLGLGNHKLHDNKEVDTFALLFAPLTCTTYSKIRTSIGDERDNLQVMLESYHNSITNWGQLTTDQTADSP